MVYLVWLTKYGLPGMVYLVWLPSMVYLAIRIAVENLIYILLTLWACLIHFVSEATYDLLCPVVTNELNALQYDCPLGVAKY